MTPARHDEAPAPGRDASPAKRSRVSRKRPSPIKRFLLGAGLPVVGFLAIAIAWRQGWIDASSLPPGMDENLVVLGVLIVALFVVASVSLPAAHAVVKSADEAFARRSDVITGRREGSRLGALLSAPLLAVTFVVAWPLRLILMIVSLAFLAASVVFTVRLFRPDFLQAWVDRGASWLGIG